MSIENNITITFPDGNKKKYQKGITGIQVAESIAKSLAKDAIAVSINGIQKDLCDEINSDSNISIITVNTDEGLEIMRHTLTAQVLARAVKNIYPNAKLAIGPTIDNGFYYDVYFEKPISSEDLPKIEKEMSKIISNGSSIKKSIYNKKDVIKLFNDRDEKYKIDIINNSDQLDNFQIYSQDGSDFIDLCYGPHLPNLKHIGAFKLTKLAGAYWRGDSNNEMLQRIYGTAWKNKNDLDIHLEMLKEAEKRDHRKLGREMDLFHFQEESPGSVFWHSKGWLLYQTLINYMKKRQDAAGYQEINTPDIMDRSLWEKSGHWEKFGDSMFTTEAKEDKIYALKPMSCPGAVQVYKQGIKSYRDLPLRLSEFGKVHRYEPSGALHGLMRVRGFTQDDAHIFCTEDQITDECKTVCNLILSIYKDFGFEDIHIKFSDRPEKRVGNDNIWDRSEEALKIAIEASGLSYTYNPGEGAFYGPKIEFVLRDAIGRDWQCGTLQVDLNLPERLSANFIAEDGQKYPPVMLHRALFGSIERFIGILIENYSGRLPLWLSPTQVVIATITSETNNYAEKVLNLFMKNNIRAEIDIRNEKIGYKIREHSNAKIPVLIIIGKQEAEKEVLSVRRLGSTDTETGKLEEIIKNLKIESCVPQ
ncbi:MAG: Threonine--tRNA ligase [Alphaproteobacteria bacterium MarineAlpha9_Bin3]|nr:MAG: Threonine--tRNA ligase [Alphaproteobacteria bacterium MarineAlpha9_Bin3]